jgi:monovalent cation/hydrogen antiporter
MNGEEEADWRYEEGRLMVSLAESAGETTVEVRGLYNYRRSRFSARFGVDEDGIEERSAAYQRLWRELLRAQRRSLIELRNEGVIGDEAMHRIERDLDLEESRLDA